MAGDAQSGVAIMRLTAGLDSGPVCLRASEPILPEDTYGSLAGRLQSLGGELLVRALDGPLEFVEQDESGVTLRREDRHPRIAYSTQLDRRSSSIVSSGRCTPISALA